MGKVINLRDYRDEWKEIFATDGQASTLQVYVNFQTGEAEVVQMNDDGEAIRTTLVARDLNHLVEVLNKAIIDTSNMSM
jgi:hypothetical protein